MAFRFHFPRLSLIKVDLDCCMETGEKNMVYFLPNIDGSWLHEKKMLEHGSRNMISRDHRWILIAAWKLKKKKISNMVYYLPNIDGSSLHGKKMLEHGSHTLVSPEIIDGSWLLHWNWRKKISNIVYFFPNIDGSWLHENWKQDF